MTLTKWIAILLIFCSCNPFQILSSDEKKDLRIKRKCNRKMERLKLQCPILTDTILVEVPLVISVDSQAIQKSWQVSQDTRGLDSILAVAKGGFGKVSTLDSATIDSIISVTKSNLRRYIVLRKTITDTLRIDTIIKFMIDGSEKDLIINASAWQDSNGNFHLGVGVPKQDINASTGFKMAQIREAEITFKEKAFKFLQTSWYLIVIGLIILFIIRVAWKSLRTYFRF